MKQYASGEQGFPHEIGVFLGYPVEDVEGYMQNDGKNFLLVGYWKMCIRDRPTALSPSREVVMYTP